MLKLLQTELIALEQLTISVFIHMRTPSSLIKRNDHMNNSALDTSERNPDSATNRDEIVPRADSYEVE
jgi:hypothetical protein